jgi:hypothetical protein
MAATESDTVANEYQICMLNNSPASLSKMFRVWSLPTAIKIKNNNNKDKRLTQFTDKPSPLDGVQSNPKCPVH